MDNPVLTPEEAARFLGLSPRRFQERRKALVEAGFPRPLPGLKGPRWSRALVEAWIANAGQPVAKPRPLPDVVAEARTFLERRIGRRAA